MILATNVTKKFGKLTALDSINLSCNKGESIALIGPNGSGKTTFIKCLLGMVVPDSGFITFNKQNIKHDWEYRSKIGYMPQIGRFPENMRIAQVIDMMKDIRKSFTTHLDEELIWQFGLDKIMDKRMRTLSGGTRQKVGASLAFMFQPDVLILDEPTAGLDPVSTEILKAKISKEKANGKLIMITSHVLSELDEIITQVIYMQDGKLKFHKSFEQLKHDTGEVQLSKAMAQIMKNI
ncbi:ABC transporter ATP-binding protein [Segetibacter koreensis]|uniref:ABC transporter ATP-binding protein n=1 Tax=Segetibacter koreensis TaxID=398037 RepID=UPI00037BB59F|nr:ATP-binding cassette domain-containing protein [Segetibacter koreensis]